MYRLNVWRKHELNAVNWNSAQSFSPFWEVVLLFFNSTFSGQWNCNVSEIFKWSFVNFASQGVDLVYLQTGIGWPEYFLGFEFGESVFFWGLITAAVFFGLSNKSCILKCFLFSKIFFGFSYIHQVLQLNHGSLLLSYHAWLSWKE